MFSDLSWTTPAVLAVALSIAACSVEEDTTADTDPVIPVATTEGVDPELGELTIVTDANQEDTQAYCSISMMRTPAENTAVINASLSVVPFGESATSEWNFGELNFAWVSSPETGLRPMTVSFEAPASLDSDTDSDTWLYDEGSSEPPAFSMLVEGESYDFAVGPVRDADDVSRGPHLWPTGLSVSGTLVRFSNGVRAAPDNVEFDYTGPCMTDIRILGE